MKPKNIPGNSVDTNPTKRRKRIPPPPHPFSDKMRRIDPAQITIYNLSTMDLMLQLYIERVARPIEEEYKRATDTLKRLRKDLVNAQRRKLAWKISQLEFQLEEFEFFSAKEEYYHLEEQKYLEEFRTALTKVKESVKQNSAAFKDEVTIDGNGELHVGGGEPLTREAIVQILPTLQYFAETGSIPGLEQLP